MEQFNKTIPSFALYGEPEANLASLLHIETIATRSATHDWEIGVHRHPRSIQFVLVEDGSATIVMDGVTHTAAPPLFFCVPQGTVHGFRFSPETKGYVLTLSADFLAVLDTRDDPLMHLLTHGGCGAVPSGIWPRIEWLARELLSATTSWSVDGRLARALAESLLRSLPARDAEHTLDPRLALFRQLVERHLAEHRPVEFYAREAGLSQRTLGRLCAEHLGCSPRQAINRRMAAEADRMLRQGNASVVQVSDALGFKDPSYFSRFFQREAGQRPSAVRKADEAPETIPATPSGPS